MRYILTATKNGQTVQQLYPTCGIAVASAKSFLRNANANESPYALVIDQKTCETKFEAGKNDDGTICRHDQ